MKKRERKSAHQVAEALHIAFASERGSTCPVGEGERPAGTHHGEGVAVGGQRWGDALRWRTRGNALRQHARGDALRQCNEGAHMGRRVKATR
jgi:hypothetical protein